MRVEQIRTAFAGLRDMGLTNDAQVLRMCQKSYQRHSDTRIKLAYRLAINRAIEAAKDQPGATLLVRDNTGETYTIFATTRALNGLTARLRIEHPERFLRLAEASARTQPGLPLPAIAA